MNKYFHTLEVSQLEKVIGPRYYGLDQAESLTMILQGPTFPY